MSYKLTAGVLGRRRREKKGFILDLVPNAVGAYSMRLLSSSYTGDCMQVQRDADDALLDIGFVNGVIDVAALETFANGGRLLVRTWYDQSGLGNNALQTIKARQPWITDTLGNVYTENGKPAIFFNGSGVFSTEFSLPCPRLISSSNYLILSCLQINTTGSNQYAVVSQNDFSSASRTNFITKRSNNELGYASDVGGAYIAASDDNEQKVIITSISGSNLRMLIDNNNYLLDDSYPSFSPLNFSFQIGGARNSETSMNGMMQEVIVYNQDKYSDVETLKGNVNSYYNLY